MTANPKCARCGHEKQSHYGSGLILCYALGSGPLSCSCFQYQAPHPTEETEK